jgi:acyl-CoA thioesterase
VVDRLDWLTMYRGSVEISGRPALSALGESLALTPNGDSGWIGRADPRFEAIVGTFGGWTAALLLNAVVGEPRRTGQVVASTVNFISAVVPNSELNIRTELLGGGSSVQQWRVEMRSDGDTVNAVAMVTTASRRETDGFAALDMPDVAPPEQAGDPSQPPGPFGERMDFRPLYGYPPFGWGRPDSRSWVREKSGRSIDVVQLALLSDAYPPRIFNFSDAPRPFATLTLSVYFHADEDQLAALGDDYVLNDATATQAASGIVGQQAQLWSRDGLLLATTEQLGSYR